MADKASEQSTAVDAIRTRSTIFDRVFGILGSEEAAATTVPDGTSVNQAPTVENPSIGASSVPPTIQERPLTADLPEQQPVSLCRACGSPLLQVGACTECGFVAASPPVSLAPHPLAAGTLLRTEFEIVEFRRRRGTINIYSAKNVTDGRRLVIKEAARSESATVSENGEPTPSIESMEPAPSGDSSAGEASPAADADVCADTVVNPVDATEEALGTAVPAAESTTEITEPPPEPAVEQFPPTELGVTEEPLADLDEQAATIGDASALDTSAVMDATSVTAAAAPEQDASLVVELDRERQILRSIKYPTVPRFLASFQQDDRCYLVCEHLGEKSLREAWSHEDTSESQRVDWLIQLCQGLAKVHAQGALYNDVHPDSLAIDDRNRLVLPDFSQAVQLPLSAPLAAATRYTAPELLLDPAHADARADLFSLGAAWMSLLLGRELCDDDFELEFTPHPYSTQFPDANPLLARLVFKTFARNPDQRFPSEEERARGAAPTAELQRSLLAYKQVLRRRWLSIGVQTSIGAVRTANEDNFFAAKFTCKSGDEAIETGLLVVADGMGGAEAGEIASEIAVAAVRDALLPQIHAWAAKSDSEQGRLVPTAIASSIHAAHEAVRGYCSVHPDKQGLGCTLDVLVILGEQAFIGHVGDSRVGRINRDGLSWLTEDQTLVNRLLKLKIINEQEAETHPDRSQLLQAIGGSKQVDPNFYTVAVAPNDTFLCCSDGLMAHLNDSRILDIVRQCSTPQQASDHLVNEANVSGGTDNTTVMIVRVD